MPYKRLVLGVLLVNLALAVLGSRRWADAGSALPALGLLAQANIALSVIFRQQALINALGRPATAAPPSWPLWLRWALAKSYHHGGLHVGTAVAGTACYLAFVAVLLPDPSALLVARLVALLVVLLLVVIIVLASPRVRHRRHDGFELSHRLGGWAALALIWVSTVLLAPDLGALVTDPAVWLLLTATLGVAWPWLRLRRVTVDVEIPSDHVALVTLVWVTRNSRRTYGDDLVQEIPDRQPDATIWDTERLGKPDVLRLACSACPESGAEAVICVSNRTVTGDLVHGLERRGIPAFGPVFDS